MACSICDYQGDTQPVTIPAAEGQSIKIKACPKCLAISESYYLSLCHKCGSKTWVLANIVDEQLGGLKGKDFSVLMMTQCISCEGHRFHRA